MDFLPYALIAPIGLLLLAISLYPAVDAIWLAMILIRLGVIDQYVSWLSDPDGAFAIVVATMVWAGMPLMAIILLAGLQAIQMSSTKPQ